MADSPIDPGPPPYIALDRQRRQASLTLQECWMAYFALGGHSDLATVENYFQGGGNLSDFELYILETAIRDHPASEASDESLLGAEASSLVADRRAVDPRARATPWGPMELVDERIVIRSERTTAIHLAPKGDAHWTLSGLGIAQGSLLRIDRAADPNWEMHSAGDELLVLLTGTLVVAIDDAELPPTVLDQPYQACVVPRGRWHRHQATETGTQVMFLTPRQDTQTRSNG